MMSLTIYSDRHRPPEGVNIITQNDVYFNGAVELTGSKLEAVILHHIDRARYCSSRSFYGISSDTVPVDKNQLSTGTKTLLNVLSNPALCFDLRECGDNALELLPPRDRIIVELKYFEDMKLEDIAAIMEENTNTIKSRLYRSLKKLRLSLD